ncbi:Protein of uncharacterised function (DUF1214) [Mycolicibacterium aurum]|uniref:Protein of uncharacterized function (DUF1214) n=2 Tax=Mycolicibacterium aurum TaxID=1791 RepID=A0A3S4RUY7_MYCAU|nr:DUF1214 domain-containing protein [Mycolicibacterium aurum]VEG53064.1 Protein of uncharacterised function (DUF1214) [Mycolicibacterium aurum]
MTPQHPEMPSSRHGRYVGRVGALAVALGIGAAIANGSAVAAADDGASGSESSDTSQTSQSESPDRDAGASTPESGPTSTSRADAEDSEGADEVATEDIEEPDDQDDASPAAKTRGSETRATIDVVGPSRDSDESDTETDEPASPESTAMWTLVGAAPRREPAPDTAPPSEQTAAPIDTQVNTKAVADSSPLGTEQQLEAERIAAATVKTWPVQLMQRVLEVGWLLTAIRQYGEIGGPDWENFRQLGRAVDEYAMGAAFQQQLLNPMTPTVVTQVAPPHTWYGRAVGGSRILYDNPDTIYRFMGVNMTSTYVIRGRFTGALPADTNFSVLTGLSGVTADNLSGRQIEIGADGSFTITVSGAPAAQGQRNHLQLTADTTLIAVRNTLSDWNTQPPMTLSIERQSGPRDSLFSQLGGFAIPGLGPMVTRSPLLTTLVSVIPPMKKPPTILRGVFTAVIMALGLGQESKYIKVATTDPQTGERVAPNVLRNPTRNAEFLATQLQSAGYFALADDQALVVTVTPGNARYFTVPVTDLWTITDNYWDEQTSLNNAQAVANPDGTYTFVISPTDPGVYNWVSTGGLNRGTISMRFQDLDLTLPVTPTLTSQLVALSDLPAVLPTTTTYVTPAQRAAQLSARKAGFDTRFGTPQ